MLRLVCVVVAVFMGLVSLTISDTASDFWQLVKLYCQYDSGFFAGLVLISFIPCGWIDRIGNHELEQMKKVSDGH